MVNRTNSDEMLLTAEALQHWRWQIGAKPGIKPPLAAIICLQSDLLHRVRRHYPVRGIKGLFGDGYLLNNNQGGVAFVGGVGPGAPAMAILVEEYFAFGVRQFISIGVAGVLQPYLKAGDIVLCDSAIRGEGTSRHYLLPERYIEADSDLVSIVQSSLADRNIQYYQGTSWTTDAPYRETRREVDYYRREGILTVEMEAAALFSTARSLGAKAASVFVVADRLLPEGWEPPSQSSTIKKNLRMILGAIIPWLAAKDKTAAEKR